MRSAALLALLTVGANAQQLNITAATQLLGTLQKLGFNSLAKAGATIANTTVGATTFAQLLAGGPFTVFAPNDHAFTGVPANISTNPNLLAEIISYHIVPGTVNTTDFHNNSNTIALTLLNATDQVFLGPGNQHQAIALRTEGDGKTHVLNQNTPVTILNVTNLPNITLYTVDAVIDLPNQLARTTGPKANNLTLFQQAATQAGLFNALDQQHGLTIFAPNDAAFTKALAALGQNATNTTLIADVLLNHVINGSVLYSTQLSGAKPTSAGGESFSFSVNATSSTVTSGNSTANIVSADNILWNGVVHVIDAVLVNAANDVGAAASAFSSATGAAATATAPSGPVGSAPAASGSGSSGKSGAVALGVDLRLVGAVLMSVFLGGAIVL